MQNLCPRCFFFLIYSAVKTCGIIKNPRICTSVTICIQLFIQFGMNIVKSQTCTHSHECRTCTIWIFLCLSLSYILGWIYLYSTHLSFQHFWIISEKQCVWVILESKNKRAESTEVAAVVFCESDRSIGLAFACCSSLTLRRSSSGSQTDGAMLFISETPTDTFSSQRRSGGVHGTPKSALRGIWARLITDTLLWAGLGVWMYPMSANWSGTEKKCFPDISQRSYGAFFGWKH